MNERATHTAALETAREASRQYGAQELLSYLIGSGALTDDEKGRVEAAADGYFRMKQERGR